MTVSGWLTFCAIEFLLCLSPGPSVLLISALSLAGDRRSALVATMGVLMANVGYFLIAARPGRADQRIAERILHPEMGRRGLPCLPRIEDYSGLVY